MLDILECYMRKISNPMKYFINQDINDMDDAIKNSFNRGRYLINRNSATDLLIYEKETGIELPKDIQEYINVCWHPYISGFYKVPECIILFSVLKRKGDNDNDILFYKDGLITMTKEWEKYNNEHLYIPIGWLGYSGGYVLYELRTGYIVLEDIDSDKDGEIMKEPISFSLKELINNLQPKELL